MLKNGENFVVDQEMMDRIAIYMDDELREKVNFELAPCTPDEFLSRYIELDPDFEDVLWNEFGLVVE